MRAALFDVFGTVVDWRHGISRAVAAFFNRHAITTPDPETFADAWRARYAPSMARITGGQRPFVRLDVLHRENLHDTLRAFQLDPGGFSEGELDDLNRAWHRLDPWPDVVAGLAAMKEQMIIAPLSNGNVSLLLNMAKRAHIPWDAILGAEVVSAYKPDPAAYLKTAALLDLPPGDITMVAAHNSDLHAASACGMATAFVARPTEHGPGQTIDLAPTGNWDYTARDFVDLAGQMGARGR